MNNTASTLVYNLYEALPGLYSASALLVQCAPGGEPLHISQKAGIQHLEVLGLEETSAHLCLLRIVEQIQPKSLEQYFNKNKRKSEPLAVLYADKALKGQIQQYVHRRMNNLLALAQKHRFLVSREAERRTLVKDVLLTIEDAPLEPMLAFRRLPEGGISYRLRLRDGQGAPWEAHTRDVVPVTNQEPWVIVDYRLYRLAHINGHMLLPFQKKNEVHVPAAQVKTYFQKVILKAAARVEHLEAEGFELVQHTANPVCRLEACHDIFKGIWALVVYMDYPGASFPCFDPRKERASLEFGDNGDDIRVVKVQRRPEAETAYLDILRQFGLEPGHGSQFIAPSDDPLYLLQWICTHRAALEERGFWVVTPQTDIGPLALYEARIEWKAQQGNDWFDLHGEIRVGEYCITFAQLAPHIQQGNRFYPLPDGAVFLIPQEWMSRFSHLALMGKQQGEVWRLLKSQRNLLSDVLPELSSSAAPTDKPPAEILPPPALLATLHPYQIQGFQWLAQHYHDNLGACLADDMGLGKTLQTIAVLLYAKARKPVAAAQPASGGAQLSLFQPVADDFFQPLQALIVLPASLVFNWQRELAQFAPSLHVLSHTGANRDKDVRLLARHDVVLTTYQTALRDSELLAKIEWEYIVLDESQQIKNKDSQVFKALSQLRARHKISLSGTPIENSLSDLWAQMQFINPDLLKSFRFFKEHFILPIEKQQDEAAKARLRALVAPYLLRRTKEEVAKDLPPLHRQILYCEMTPHQEKLYEEEKSKARNYLLEHYRPNDAQYLVVVHQTLMRLRQLVNHPGMILDDYAYDSGKFNQIMEAWDTARRAGHKALFFSSFVKYLNRFAQQWDENSQPYAMLIGSYDAARRKTEIHRFEHDPDVQAFLISIKAGGTGLNLTAADYVFILDPWWNPHVEEQAIARAHRIGQDKPVMAIKFITRNSIEDKILQLQERKMQLAEDILAAADNMKIQKDDLDFLLA